MMKRLPLIVLCCAIAAPVPAAAAKDVPQQAAAAPNWPSVKYEEKRPAVLRSGDLVVTLDTEPGSKSEYRVPTFKGVYQGRPIFTVRMPEKEDTDPEFAARVVRLDPKTALPQVVMTAYTYDAHCCIATRIATAISPDSWEIVDAPPPARRRRASLSLRRHRRRRHGGNDQLRPELFLFLRVLSLLLPADAHRQAVGNADHRRHHRPGIPRLPARGGRRPGEVRTRGTQAVARERVPRRLGRRQEPGRRGRRRLETDARLLRPQDGLADG